MYSAAAISSDVRQACARAHACTRARAHTHRHRRAGAQARKSAGAHTRAVGGAQVGAAGQGRGLKLGVACCCNVILDALANDLVFPHLHARQQAAYLSADSRQGDGRAGRHDKAHRKAVLFGQREFVNVIVEELKHTRAVPRPRGATGHIPGPLHRMADARGSTRRGKRPPRARQAPIERQVLIKRRHEKKGRRGRRQDEQRQ
jgi:hypothetical protein